MIKLFSPEAFKDYMENPEVENYNYNGVIVLEPETCELEVELDSTWQLTLVHPYDEKGRYSYIEKGAVIKLPCKIAREQTEEEQLFRIYEVREKIDNIEVLAYPVVLESIHETPINYAEWFEMDAPTLVDTLNGLMTSKYHIDIDPDEFQDTGTANIIAENTNVQEVLLGDQDLSFINCFGGEIVYDNYVYRIRENIGNSERDNKIFFGASLEDIEITETNNDVITRIFPVGGDGIAMGSDGYPKYLDDFVWYTEASTGYMMYGDGHGNYISGGYALSRYGEKYQWLDDNGHLDTTKEGPNVSEWEWHTDADGRYYSASSYEKHNIVLGWVEDASDKHYWIDSRGWYDHTYNDTTEWTWRESESQPGKWWYGSSTENYAYNGWIYIHGNNGWYLFDADGFWVEGATPPDYLNEYAWHNLPDGHWWYGMEKDTTYKPEAQWMKVDNIWYWFDDDGYAFIYEERSDHVDSDYIEYYPFVFARSVKYSDVELLDTNYTAGEEAVWTSTQMVTDTVKQDLIAEVRSQSEKYLRKAHEGDWPYPFTGSRSSTWHNRHDPWTGYDELHNRVCLPYGYLFYSYTDAIETLKEKAIPKEYFNSSNQDLYSFFCDCITDGFKWCETTEIAAWDWREETTDIQDDGLYQYLNSFTWRNDGNGDYYGDGAGHYITNGWVEDASNKHYWIDDHGYWRPEFDDTSEWSWHQNANGWSYGSDNGENHAANQWIHIASEGKWYYFNSDGYWIPFTTRYYYGTEDGSDKVFFMYHKVGSYIYWFDRDGYVDTDLKFAHNFEWHEDDNGHYYGDGNGHYIKNGWVEDSNSAHYYISSDGYYHGTAKDASTETEEDEFESQDEALGTSTGYSKLTVNLTVTGEASTASSKSYAINISGPDSYSHTFYLTGTDSDILLDLTPGEYTVSVGGTEDDGDAQISGYYLTVSGDQSRTYDIQADHRHWWNITLKYTVEEESSDDDTDEYTDTEEWTWHGSKEEGYWYGTTDDSGNAKNYPTSQFMYISDYSAWMWFDENGYFTAAWMSAGSWDWTKDGAGWYYTDGNENWPEGQWMKIDSKWYFFSTKGYADDTTDDFDAKTSESETVATLDTNREGIGSSTSTSSTVSSDYNSNREGVRAWIQDGFVNAIKNKIVQSYNTLKEHMDSQLLAYAQADLNSSDSSTVTIDIDVKQIAGSKDYEKFKWLSECYLGDTVHIESSKHSLSVDERITKLTYDCITQKVSEITLGYPSQYSHIRNAKLVAKKGTFRPYVSLIYLENGWDTVDDKYLSASNKPGKELEAKR